VAINKDFYRNAESIKNKIYQLKLLEIKYSEEDVYYVIKDSSILAVDMAFNIELPERKKTNIDKELVEKVLKVLKSDYYNELISISREKSNESNMRKNISYNNVVNITLTNTTVKKLKRKEKTNHMDYSGDLPF
jgi:hypothetical protein